MAVVLHIRWEAITPALYDQVRTEVDWEGRPTQGAMFHIAWFESDGLHVVGLFESAEDFQRFAEQRLKPVTQRLGIPGGPEVTVNEVYRAFDPRNREVVVG